MKYKTIFILLIIVLLSNSVYGVTLPSTLDVEDIKDSIEETSKYCFDEAVKRDQETKVYIEEKLNDIYQDINYRLTFFKFVYSIVTFIVVFLAIYINSWLSFRRNIKIDRIKNANLTINDNLTEKEHDKPPILKKKKVLDRKHKEKDIKKK